jgi:DNA-binding transcriptional regulator YiaG
VTLDAPVLVVERVNDLQLPARQLAQLPSGGERNDALLLPLVNRRYGAARGQGAGNASTPTKKRLSCLDSHGQRAYSMLESHFKDAVGRIPYASCGMETMGQRIKRLRESRGWSQSNLADMVGVTVSAVSQWELDQTENVKLVPFLRLAKVFETDPYYLVFGPERGTEELSKPVLTTTGKRRPRS